MLGMSKLIFAVIFILKAIGNFEVGAFSNAEVCILQLSQVAFNINSGREVFEDMVNGILRIVETSSTLNFPASTEPYPSICFGPTSQPDFNGQFTLSYEFSTNGGNSATTISEIDVQIEADQTVQIERTQPFSPSSGSNMPFQLLLSFNITVRCLSPFLGTFCEICIFEPSDTCCVPDPPTGCIPVVTMQCNISGAARLSPDDTFIQGGLSVSMGVAEVCYNDVWTPVCGEQWHLCTIDTFCRELNATQALNVPFFGCGVLPVLSPVVVDPVCSGPSSNLSECIASGNNTSISNCSCDNIASVICLSVLESNPTLDSTICSSQVPNSILINDTDRGYLMCDCLCGYDAGTDSQGRLINCTDVNECDDSPCDDNANCTNTLGDYVCQCMDGYYGNGVNCTDVNECDDDPCDVNANCTNTNGSFLCSCYHGYEGNGMCCRDIDECQNATDNGVDLCLDNGVANATCMNLDGNFTCNCSSGYIEDFSGSASSQLFPFTCVDVDECNISLCHENANCSNGNGTFTCECMDGYKGDGFCCNDINECDDSPCDDNANCTNTLGDYVCQCMDGYYGDGVNCTDVNECDNDPCDVNANCTNTNGSFLCSCYHGYEGNGMCCRDIDECQNATDNGVDLCLDNGVANATCMNLDGNFTCNCSSGYIEDFSGSASSQLFPFTCVDIDECNISLCHENANCSNGNGTFTCECMDGYTGDGFCCNDINECDDSPCDDNANCTNTLGDYVCQCMDGYYGNGVNCTDVNECDNDPCDVNANCTNTNGSFLCFCSPGYEGNGMCCRDIDECQNATDNGVDLCLDNGVANATCMNLDGNFTCNCSSGYIEDFSGSASSQLFPFTCVDINECADNPCDDNAVCHNADGNFSCSCDQGYTGNGFCCTELECPSLEPEGKREFDPFVNKLRNRSGIAEVHCTLDTEPRGISVLVTCDDAVWAEPLPICSDDSSGTVPLNPSLRIRMFLATTDETPTVYTDEAQLLAEDELVFATESYLDGEGRRKRRSDDFLIRVYFYNCSGSVLEARRICYVVITVDGIFLSPDQLKLVIALVEGPVVVVVETDSSCETNSGAVNTDVNSNQLSAGAIVGIVLAVITASWILLILMAALIYKFNKRNVPGTGTVAVNLGAIN